MMDHPQQRVRAGPAVGAEMENAVQMLLLAQGPFHNHFKPLLLFSRQICVYCCEYTRRYGSTTTSDASDVSRVNAFCPPILSRARRRHGGLALLSGVLCDSRNAR